MGVEIRPEPTSEEREAILRALVNLDADGPRSAWWEAGVHEATEGQPDADPDVGPGSVEVAPRKEVRAWLS